MKILKSGRETERVNQCVRDERVSTAATRRTLCIVLETIIDILFTYLSHFYTKVLRLYILLRSSRP